MAGAAPQLQLLLPLLADNELGLSRESGGVPSRTLERELSSPPQHWDDIPLALMEGKHLRAVTAAAARLRVRAGMTAAEARALCANLGIFVWDDAIINAAITSTTASFLSASPQVTPVAGAPGTWWVGAGGMDGLGGDRALARALRAIASNWHPAPRVAVADSCVAARAATWSEAARLNPHVIVTRGGCAAYLAGVPLTLVPMDAELRDTLYALGIRTAGMFASLEAEDVERRWGADGLRAWQLAHGEDRRRPVLARVDTERSVSAELAMPADTVEPLLFLVNAALTRLASALVSDARAAAAIAITLTLDAGRGALPSGGVSHTVTREVRPARPIARVAPMREMCRALLEGWTLAAPVCGVTVAITATAPSSAEQGNLLDTEWTDPAAAEAALDRLRAELGTGSVVRPVAKNTHRLEHAGSWVNVLAAANADAEENARENGAENADDNPEENAANHAADMHHMKPHHAALRLLDPPEPADVECVNNIPRIVHWRSSVFHIARAVGPERLSGDWWKDGYRRDYWHCEEENEHSDLILYRDRTSGEWLVQGWWD